MTDKSKFVFDERKKTLTHTMVDEVPLMGKEEYGTFIRRTEVISSEEGTVRILMFLENQERGLKSEIEDLEKRQNALNEQIEAKKKDLKKVKSEKKMAKEAIGERINFKKIQKEIEEKEKTEKEKK